MVRRHSSRDATAQPRPPRPRRECRRGLAGRLRLCPAPFSAQPRSRAWYRRWWIEGRAASSGVPRGPPRGGPTPRRGRAREPRRAARTLFDRCSREQAPRSAASPNSARDLGGPSSTTRERQWVPVVGGQRRTRPDLRRAASTGGAREPGRAQARARRLSRGACPERVRRPAQSEREAGARVLANGGVGVETTGDGRPTGGVGSGRAKVWEKVGVWWE
jgi:hypothetical protein